MGAKATLKDIARATNFSTATVSLALSGKKTRVSAATKEKIITAARELNYRPNYIAQSLVTSRTMTLGMVLPNFNDQIFTRFAAGMETYARVQGYSILFCNSDDRIDTCISQIKVLCSRGVEGMAIIPPAMINETDSLKDFTDTLNETAVPYILVDRAVHDLYHDYVATDNIHGGFLAGEYLLSLGHRRIGAIAGPMTEYGTIKRLAGLKEAFRQKGLEFDESLLVCSDYTFEGGCRAAAQLLPKNVTAIFAFNDLMAIGAYKAAGKAGYRIPDDISVIGFDDNPVSKLVYPALTTISQPSQTIGSRACEILLERIKDPERKNCDYFFSPSLVIRKSTRAIEADQ